MPYILGVLTISAATYLQASVIIVIYTFSYTALIAGVYVLVEDFTRFQRVVVNAAFITVVAGLLGVMMFNYRREHYYDKKIIEEKNEALQILANRDAMTKLFNHTKFYELLETEILHVQKNKGDLVLALLDIDHFKQVNDTYGHIMGDRVLIYVANLIQTHIGENGFVGRYGGEEFSIILMGKSLSESVEIVNTMRKIMENTVIDDQVQITFSGGVVLWQNESADLLVDKADQLLYQAKNMGRNCIRFTT
jgi:diguanylate cyclase (GGDEF)-like protein